MLVGKFVTLRIIERNDIEMIRQWRNRPDNYKYFANRDFISEVQQENWFASKGVAKDCLRLMILDNESHQPIGMTHLESIDFRNRNAIWGIYIAVPEFRRRVYALEATILLFDYAFNYLNLAKIYGNTLAANKRGRAFHKRMGFNEEAVFKNHVFIDGHYTDLIWIALFGAFWKARKTKQLKAFLTKTIWGGRITNE